MKVFITTVSKESLSGNSWGRRYAEKLIFSGNRYPHPEIKLARNPSEADIILFAERRDAGPYFEFIKETDVYKKYKTKCFVFGPSSHALPCIPGIYPSVDKKFYRPSMAMAGFYILELDLPKKIKPVEEADFLYSFHGSINTHPSRARLKAINDSRFLFVDTERKNQEAVMRGDVNMVNFFKNAYIESCLNSKFILCPRGANSGSFRLFETMKMGRVPVVISDQWVPTEGIDWSSFSVRVHEKDILKIPSILREKEDGAGAMAERAKEVFENYFSEKTMLKTIVSYCEILKRRRRKFPKARFYYQILTSPFHLSRYLKTRLQLWKKTGKIYL